MKHRPVYRWLAGFVVLMTLLVAMPLCPSRVLGL